MSPALVSMIGQRGQRAAAQGVGELGGPLEQARVQVEDVARVRLAARWAPQEQRDGAVGLGLLGEVVVDDERVLAVLHPVLAHGAAGVGGEVLERGRVAGRGHDHHGVLEGMVLLEGGHGLGHRRVLLADGDVDALHALAGLVDDGVDGHGRLARLAVADDQLALAPADGRHGVDGLDAGLHGLAHRLAADDAGRLHLHAPGLGGVDRALAVDRLAQGVDHTTEKGVADRHGLDAAGRLDRLLFLEAVDLAEDDGADGVFVQVQGQAQRAVLELEQFVDRRAGKARHPGDAVTDLDDAADLLGPDRRGVLLDVALERLGDLTGVDRQLCHQSAPSVWSLEPVLAGRTRRRSQPAGGKCSRRASSRPRAVASTCRSPM